MALAALASPFDEASSPFLSACFPALTPLARLFSACAVSLAALFLSSLTFGAAAFFTAFFNCLTLGAAAFLTFFTALFLAFPLSFAVFLAIFVTAFLMAFVFIATRASFNLNDLM